MFCECGCYRTGYSCSTCRFADMQGHHISTDPILHKLVSLTCRRVLFVLSCEDTPRSRRHSLVAAAAVAEVACCQGGPLVLDRRRRAVQRIRRH